MRLTPKLLRARLARTKDPESRLLIQRSLLVQLIQEGSRDLELEIQATLDEHTSEGYVPGISWAYLFYGRFKFMQGQPVDAIALYRKSMDAAEQTEDEELRAEILMCTAIAKRENGAY